MNRRLLLLASTLALSSLAAVGCGPVPTEGDACATPGANRCSGTVVQACAAGDDGKLVWISGVNCAATGRACDPVAGQCVVGGGQTDGGGGTTDGGSEDGGSNGSDGGMTDAGEQLPAHCSNTSKDGDETAVDCGGSCAACATGQTCEVNEDCASEKCGGSATQPVCVVLAPNCMDGQKNSDETDVDCGGTCGSCAEGKTCVVHTDCATNVCDLLETHTCITASPTYLVNEDFETGDLTKFAYTLESAADHNWEIETDAAKCHGGSFCLRTSKLHALDETSKVSVSLSVREDTVITFWAKVFTEENHHYFRFYVDGVEQQAVSGDVDWKLYSFPVKATGPNGPNRVLTFEYQRSTYVDPNHVPWNEVWIDDINFPDWNTEPTVPELLAPWNGKLTTSTQPTFRWQSFDSDFDPITYELQYATSPSFSNPISTGETNDVSFIPPAPLTDNTLYYWRVRAKDNSNFRWSAWSATSVVEINSAYEYASVWRQNDVSQFSMNFLSGAIATASGVQAAPGTVNASATTGIAHTGGTASVTLNNLSPCTGTATLTIAASGDFSVSTETATVSVDGTVVGTYNPSVCNSSRTFGVDCALLADGSATVSFTTSSSVNNGGCSGQTEQWTASFNYSVPTLGEMTSIPIQFTLFDGKKLWEKVHVVGTGTIKLQVLDAQGALIPDTQIPGNSTGTTARTLRLFDLDPALYPVIRLKATMSNGGTLTEWSVVGNDVHEWLFSHDTDAEGWQGFDVGATPDVAVANGALKLFSTAAGTDPNIQFTFPQPIAATRFTTVEVRVKTSNAYSNDNPTLFWQSNFGLFDARRSFTLPNQFLVTFKDLTFDLTVVPQSPNEPWQGNIEKLRLDPVERFLDQVQMPADGSFEIERIAIY